ncbi:MAG: hypothetical protein A2V86_05135 [Deltaproteobacteria bacterium RBG_16_49_23]|nr:MAG: hypothetical protein A2V86_05135 [Deltaproteobacteria bacterium RBG_16_49_23]
MMIQKTHNPPSPPLSKSGMISPPFGLRPRAVSDPESKGRLGGILYNPRGLSVLFLVIAMMLMVSIGYVFSYLIPTKQKSVSLTISSNQAFFIAQSGVEFAVRYANGNGWTTPAELAGLTGMTRNLGAGRFTLTYTNTSPNLDTLTSVGEVPVGTARRSIRVSNFTSFLMEITYFGSASTPADNGTNTANPTAVVPPGSMQAGDLVLMIAQARDSTATIAISSTGGQSWTSETQQNQANCRIRLFWCRFNGTWTLPNPSVSFGSVINHIVVMHVFRPSNTSSVWEVDVPQVSGNFAAPPAPRTVTIPEITTITDGALVFAAWASSDDNTWGSLTGGWSTPGSAQYRNTSGADASQTHAYKVMATAGASGNVSKNQATLGGDAGARLIIAFKAVII